VRPRLAQEISPPRGGEPDRLLQRARDPAGRRDQQRSDRLAGDRAPRERVLQLDRDVPAQDRSLLAAAGRAPPHLPPPRRRTSLMAAVVLRALTLLGVTGASCSLFFQQLSGGDWLGPFVSSNTMTFANRQRLLIGIVAGAAVGVVLGLMVLWRRGARGIER